ncbi:three-helix bundle dimerization domain-containing protein [Streptomyces sp. Tue6028]|uniref:three-helix bundle dimerization domain-containing protein n=1 Tax=Streptomyces sp. Tue6028 TaxID=2036037 RepID=UPI003EB7C187
MSAATGETVSAEEKAIRQVAERLQSRYAEATPAAIEAAVRASEDRLRDSRIRDFVPIFVERRARALLDASGENAEPLRPE